MKSSKASPKASSNTDKITHSKLLIKFLYLNHGCSTAVNYWSNVWRHLQKFHFLSIQHLYKTLVLTKLPIKCQCLSEGCSTTVNQFVLVWRNFKSLSVTGQCNNDYYKDTSTHLTAHFPVKMHVCLQLNGQKYKWLNYTF